MTDTIREAAKALAAAEKRLTAAEAEHRTLLAEVETIQTRLSDALRRREEAMTASAAAPDDGVLLGRLRLAERDVNDLEALLAAAKDRAAGTEPARERLAAQQAAEHLQRARDTSELESLRRHADELDRTLLRTVAEMSAVASRLGYPRKLSAYWRCSAALRDAVTFDNPPR